MQSGRGNSRQWVLEHEPSEAREIEPLMGFTSSGDMRTQIRLSFATLEAAEAYAQKSGIAYAVQPEHKTTDKRVSYSDNFKFDRKTPWTH